MGGEKNERPENMICCGPWNSESKRLSRRIHADLTPLQNLHAHAHCRLDTIADLTLGRLFPKQANALLVSALYFG